MIDWSKISKDDHETIVAIAQRFEAAYGKPEGYQRLNLIMDLEAAHIACPIDLPGLLAADPTTFGHDVGGISRHINRETGELGGCFVPRTARREPIEAPL